MRGEGRLEVPARLRWGVAPGYRIRPRRRQRLGIIEPRKVADFVVLGANPLEHDKSKLSQIQAIQTYLNGKPTVSSHSPEPVMILPLRTPGWV